MKALPNPPRLREVHDGSLGGDLIRGLGPARGLSASEEASVAAHLRSLQARERGWRWQWVAGLATGLLVFVTFDVALARVWWPALQRRWHPAAGTPPPIAARPALVEARPATAEPNPRLDEVELNEIEVPRAALPMQKRQRSLAAEASALAPVLANLDREPRRALKASENYERRFHWSGALAGEAAVARVATLLQLGQPERALVFLDQFGAPGEIRSSRSPELAVVHGELSLRFGREPGLALAAFERALKDGVSGSLQERALYGEVLCQRREGQAEEARRVASLYLDRFPGGRFAPALRGLATKSN